MKLSERHLRSNIRKLFWFEILSGAFFAIPILVLFWQANGLSFTEIMILQSLFAIITVILEIPTGIFADRVGRKKAMVISAITTLLAITVYCFGTNFWHFLLGEVLFAMRLSFKNGTESAMMYDTLLELGEEKHFKRIWGNLIFYDLIMLAVSGIFGGFIATHDLRWALIASVPFFIAIIPIALSLHETELSLKSPMKKVLKWPPCQGGMAVGQGGLMNGRFYYANLKKLFLTSLSALGNHKKITWVIIYSGVIYAFNQAALWLYQPYLKLTGIDIAYFGIVFACFQFVAAISGKYAHLIEEKLGQKYSLVLLAILVTGSYFLMSSFIFLFSFSFAFLQQFVRGFRSTIMNDYINHHCESSVRATVLSIDSFVGKLGYAIILPIIGWIADVFSLVQALEFLGILALVMGSGALLIMRRIKIL